ncbi:MAG: NAD(P)H-dependent oxidoreductase [Bdellovibrionales bacterium]|nr:NAD(P)H-dependent oxidoreductase [Bdellovibrionales bacterium]
MIYIISGTNRPNSRTRQVAEHILRLYKDKTHDAEIIDLATLPFNELASAPYGSQELPPDIQKAIAKIDAADGLVIITPEYNGSMPGALKYFIDHWSYPKSFEYRPVAFIGLGFRWGGLRPVEHLQQVFGYRNAYIFPERIFLSNITNVLVDGKITDEAVAKLMEKQTSGFMKFISALKSEKLHSNQI